MTKNKKFLISVPYIYPVCPLSIDHAKIMLVADINARTARAENKDVVFPIAAHYSGVTAENTIEKLHSEDITIKNKERDKFLKIYKTPRNIVDSFDNSEFLLDYYTSQTIMDLKRLNISCDFTNFYKTNERDYEIFVNTIFDNYDKQGVLINNSKGELSLNYDDLNWREKTKSNLDNLNIMHPSLKNNIISSFDNVRSDWGVLRNYGIGVPFKKNYIIDPMFDSELFVIYDLYKKFANKNNQGNIQRTFEMLFGLLKSPTDMSNHSMINSIIEWLPTDLFVCEEHLKNWIIKKSFAEGLLFDKKYLTNNYFITGMGYVEGQRMSSSRGTAILLKDLLDKYGNTITRMIIMFTGGHPSKMYHYSEQNIITVTKMLKDFYNYINYINAKTINSKLNKIEYVEEFDLLNTLLHNGYYQQLLVEIMNNMLKKCYEASTEELLKTKNTIVYFLNILLPDIKI